MIYNSEYPILNFDDNKKAKLTAQMLEGWENLHIKYGVVCFEIDAREAFAKAFPSRVIGTIKACGVTPLNLYVVNYNGTEIILHQGIMGAPMAATVMEDLVALGCEKVVAMGSAGVLNQEIARGHLIVPTSAVRQEGTSYHYVAPGKYIEHDKDVVDKMCKYLDSQKIPFVRGRTWTTDAIYRETEDLIKMRKDEGCLCVEMENATFGAVAQFYNIKFGQLLYGADCLDGALWCMREWASDDVKQQRKFEILKLAMDLVKQI